MKQSRKEFADNLAKLNKDIAEAKGKNEVSKAGVLERQNLTGAAQKSAQQAGDSLLQLREQETATAKALYPEIEGKADAKALNTALQGAADQHLAGSEKLPPALARIIKETSEVPGKSTGPAIAGRTLDLSNPSDLAAYRRYKASGAFTPEEIARIEGKGTSNLDFNKLHGYYSELGREMYSRELPGDEFAADAAARKAIGGQMEEMAAKEHKSYRFGVAQRNWAKLENTFYNTAAKSGSPLARVLQAIDPITRQVRPEYVQSILSEPKSYAIAQRLLSGYKGGTNVQAMLQLMKENMEEARGLPKRPREVPVPKGPSQEIFDPVKARRDILQNRVPSPITPSLFWKYTVIRNLMRKLANIPSVQDWLSQNPS